MILPPRTRARQLALLLTAPHRPPHLAAESDREALLTALADLLLEALGDEVALESNEGGGDESESHV